MDTEEEYQHNLSRLQRDINCLVETDRSLKKGALNNIERKAFDKTISNDTKKRLFEDCILKNLLYCLSDDADFIREKTLKILTKFFVEIEKTDDNNVNLIITSLLRRVEMVPFLEKSEEVRLAIVKLLAIIVDKWTVCFNSDMAAMSSALQKLQTDPYPEIKKETGIVIQKFCKQLPEQIGLNARAILISLAENTRHQHSKVRKLSLETMTALLLVPQGGDSFKEISQFLKPLSTDKSSDVRKATFYQIEQCLMHFNTLDLKSTESKLVQFLQTGLDDDNDGIRKTTLLSLDRCGESIEKAAIEA